MFTPFRGTTYTGDVAPVSSPPYDMIDDPAVYLGASPHSIVRLLLPPTYQQAADLLNMWRSTGVVTTDDTARFYLYTMRYLTADGTEREARGVVGAMGVQRFGDKILAHEETMTTAGADRLELLRATRANLDLIIALSPSPDLASLLEPDGEPRCTFERDGVRHALYDLDRPGIEAAVDAYPLSIADGHHRFKAALDFQAEHDGPGPWDSVMAFVTPARGSGLEIRPIHRFFPTLRGGLAVESFTAARSDPDVPVRPGTITMVRSSGSWLLTPRDTALRTLPAPFREASTAVARALLYPALGVAEEDAVFHHEPARLLVELEHSSEGAVLLMAAVPESAVLAAAEARLRFPRKTTLFTPKPRAGLVFRSY